MFNSMNFNFCHVLNEFFNNFTVVLFLFSLNQKLSFCNTTSCPKQQRTRFDIAKRIRKLFICYKTVFFAILFERWWPLPKTSANFSAQSKSHFLLFLVFLVPKLGFFSSGSLLIISHMRNTLFYLTRKSRN